MGSAYEGAPERNNTADMILNLSIRGFVSGCKVTMNRRVGQSLFIRIFRQGMVSPWERIKPCLYVLFFTL